MISAPNAILIAERDASLRQVLSDITHEHFPTATIHIAQNADEVLQLLPALRPPCAAVLHWTLVGEGVGNCIASLRAASIPVLLTSGWIESPDAKSVGADLGLRKPFDLTLYVEMLGRLLQLRQTASASPPTSGCPPVIQYQST